ncbi:hypothetical protein ACU5JM_04705 [Rhodococcus erythropolis]|uniref:hypothetical protein n=1 Tax=Rhodococcus erythropolis TaxID=1833 RepID=UPI00406BA029
MAPEPSDSGRVSGNHWRQRRYDRRLFRAFYLGGVRVDYPLQHPTTALALQLSQPCRLRNRSHIRWPVANRVIINPCPVAGVMAHGCTFTPGRGRYFANVKATATVLQLD